MRKDHYIFPAIFDFADNRISIEFPDLPGCLPCANDAQKAINNAKEAMALHLYRLEQNEDDIPEPTPITKLRPEQNQAILLIEVLMPVYRNAIENRAVKKTLTIPKWLNDLAEREKVNFSQVLQDALKTSLGINK
ncbi:MAG: hypothetical protein A4E53_01050 [Pelotomaculum sp. PtaB.Bin104]|nr:MAG: hypothetical protein A4E53_01050 [Pelotomaculum sp. PtaB.Bin104]